MQVVSTFLFPRQEARAWRRARQYLLHERIPAELIRQGCADQVSASAASFITGQSIAVDDGITTTF